MGGTYHDLRAWQSAMKLALKIYHATNRFPREIYGLTSQLRRAAVSVPSNIAEGKGRSSDRELLQYLSRARGSVYDFKRNWKLRNLSATCRAWTGSPSASTQMMSGEC